MKPVVITEDAWNDLLDIARFIAEDHPDRALRFLDMLHAKCHSLGANPRAFGLVPGFESSNIRRRVHGAYLIIFRERGPSIEVLRVLHGARDITTLLQRKPEAGGPKS